MAAYEAHATTPHAQFESGVPLEQIQCSVGMVLLESPRGTPACVRVMSADLLALRGFVPVDVREEPTAVTGTGPRPEPEPVPAGSPNIQNIVSSSNRFALDFYRQAGGGNDGNVFFSPTSMYVAFSILYEGARGETAAEIGEVFGLEPDAEKRRAEAAELTSVLNREDPDYALHAANALWIDSGIATSTRDEYVDLARDHYGVHVEVLDLEQAGTARINEWSSENTGGRINDLSKEGEFADNPQAAITAAVYFNADWENQFPEENTFTGTFWAAGSTAVDAEMMEHYAPRPYASLDGLSVLGLPYKGERISMLVILPDGRDGIGDLEESVTAERISEWREALYPTDVFVELPKFKIKTEYGLKPMLQEMGIRKAFTPESDLSGIPLPLVTDARHNAFVDVSERGTEAAAATIVTSVAVSVPPLFRADHPFMFAILDDETGALLFMGRVMDPTA
ncbi:MAG: serpin family protein [Nitrosopumilus sp.]|nr:serpin family protein [Nitrosopumilus sp.]MDA7999649.1 serpin family protein [Nitrosopumilus sp.]